MNEMFGPTFQGEGSSQGRHAKFLRLYGCHLCCGYCDTPQTWDRRRFDRRAERRQIDITEIMDWLRHDPTGLLVVTGGEPLLQQHALAPVLEAARGDGIASEIRFTVSPKLGNANMRRHSRIRPDVLRSLVRTGQARWKFVVQSVADLDEVHELVTEFDLAPVWIMPEGTDSAAVLNRMRLLADPVLARGWNLTARLHILLWENNRGR